MTKTTKTPKGVEIRLSHDYWDESGNRHRAPCVVTVSDDVAKALKAESKAS